VAAEVGTVIPAADYHLIIVRPSLDEFYASNGDLRLAMHAATSLTHAIDYVFQNRGPDPRTAGVAAEVYRRELVARCFSFQVVEAFAMASKHCTMNRADLRGFSSDRQARFVASFYGPRGRRFLGDKVGGICIHWTEYGWVNLTNALRGACAELERELHELTAVPEPPAADDDGNHVSFRPDGPDVLWSAGSAGRK